MAVIGQERQTAARSRRRDLVVAVGISAYALLAAVPEPFTWQVYAVIAVPVLVVLALAVRRGWPRPFLDMPPARLARAGWWPVAIWALLFVVFAFVQLGHFFSDPRSIYPTLSSLLEQPLTTYTVRAFAIAVWIWIGWAVVDR